MSFRTPGKVAYVNARLLDPASGLDAKGALLTEGEVIIGMGPTISAPSDAEIIDCGGACLAPGLVDMRVQLREPGEEHKETLDSAGVAAAVGGVTSLVLLPDTEPPFDDASLIEFVARNLSSHKRPRRVELIDELPRNAMGKVQKKLLTRDG